MILAFARGLGATFDLLLENGANTTFDDVVHLLKIACQNFEHMDIRELTKRHINILLDEEPYANAIAMSASEYSEQSSLHDSDIALRSSRIEVQRLCGLLLASMTEQHQRDPRVKQATSETLHRASIDKNLAIMQIAISPDFPGEIDADSNKIIQKCIRQELHVATSDYDMEKVRLLMDIGTTLSAKLPSLEEDEQPFYHGALRDAFADSDLRLTELGIIRCIISHNGFDPNYPLALHEAASLGRDNVITLLIERGVEVDTQDEHGAIALHLAVLGEYQSTTMLLLENGAFVNAQDSLGDTPLHKASGKGSLEMMCLLLQNGADPRAQNKRGDIAVKPKGFTDNGPDTIEQMEILLRSGLDPHFKDGKGGTMIHTLARAERQSLDLVQMLLDRGFEVDARDQSGDTASEGHSAMVELLLNHGADIDAKGREDQTALHKASGMDAYGTVKLLCSRGAHFNAQDILS